MAIKTVLRMGEPLLFEKAELVTEFDTDALHAHPIFYQSIFTWESNHSRARAACYHRQ